jgi:hypothetical protein
MESSFGLGLGLDGDVDGGAFGTGISVTSRGAQLVDVGRVPGVGPNTGAPAPFLLFAESAQGGGRQAAGSFASDTLSKSIAPSRVATLFMSRKNVEALQEGIRYRVFVASAGRHTIGRQSDAELSIVMRSILLQEGRNLSEGGVEGTVAQVRALNASVLAFCVPRIVGEADGYVRYRSDVANLPVPMAYGALSTTKGSRSLEENHFI